jgi:hypothetical protein
MMKREEPVEKLTATTRHGTLPVDVNRMDYGGY